jgi:hypothetical protein
MTPPRGSDSRLSDQAMIILELGPRSGCSEVVEALERIRDQWSFLHSIEDAASYAIGWAIANGIVERQAQPPSGTAWPHHEWEDPPR